MRNDKILIQATWLLEEYLGCVCMLVCVCACVCVYGIELELLSLGVLNFTFVILN